MRNGTVKGRESIGFGKAIRGKYGDPNLRILGAVTDDEEGAKSILKKVSRVLNSARTSKEDLELAIGRTRGLIASSGSHESP
jgi:hypothetical protein